MKLVLALCFALVATSAMLVAQPKLEIVGGQTYDWGSLRPPKDNILHATVVLKNVGTELLTITEVKPGCGCTKSTQGKSELKPGDTTHVGLSLTLSPQQSGSITKSVTFKSNDATQPEQYLLLKLNAIRDINFPNGMYFAFQQMKVGVESSTELTIKNDWDKDLVLTGFTVPATVKLDVGAKVTVKAGETVKIAVRMTPTQKGTVSEMITCTTNHPDFGTLYLSLFGAAIE
jgi:hypothetical protein